MDGTIIGQGSFVVPATIVPVNIAIPSGVDWMYVINQTRQGTVGGANAFGFRYYWQRGMAAGSALVEFYANGGAVVTGDRITVGGFTLFDPTQNVIGNPIATTASTNATRPVVSTATTTGLVANVSVVRMSNTAQTDVNGIDMVVGAVNAGVSFTLLAASNALATAPGAIGGAGFYRVVNTDPLFYPRRRFVTNITQAAAAQVSTSVAHGYLVGQAVRFNIPSVSGMVQLNPTQDNNFLTATVASVVDAFNFTINVDTSAFTAFTWPTIAQQPSSFPEVTPVGEDTAAALTAGVDILTDATVNTGFIGMTLGTGGNGAISGAAITGPAGSVAADVVFWRAGKSSFGGL